METKLPSEVVRRLYHEWRYGYRERPLIPTPAAEEARVDAHEAAEWRTWERAMKKSIIKDSEVELFHQPDLRRPRRSHRAQRYRAR